MNVSSLISRNAYIFVLATGMLLCILTGGNIDLSVGSVVCFVGAVGAVLMGVINLGMSLMGVGQDKQKVVKGLVLLLAVIFDVVSKRGGKLIAKD